MVGAADPPPLGSKTLRACLRCHLVKSMSQFRDKGCDNCGDLHLEHDPDRIMAYTTPVFQGLLSMMSPDDSWVARWQRQERLVRGVYALQVTGTLPEEF